MVGMLDIERRSFGHDGLTIPRVALGCGNFGGVGSSPAWFGHGLGEAQARELLDAAWAMGITHFDTADAYGGGRSEQLIGSWMRSRGHRPTLTTKTYNPMSERGDHGLAPGRIARQLNSSLDRLGVESVELYLAHDFDAEVPLADTFGEFESQAAAGRLRAYGVSNFDAGQLEQAFTDGAPQAIQNAHSLLERGDERDVLPLSAEHRLAYLAFSPLSGGWLTGKYRRGEAYPEGSRMTQRPEPYAPLVDDGTFAALEALEAFAGQRAMSLTAVALAWLLADDRVTQIVLGPGRPEHLDPLREALEHPLGGDERSQLGSMFG